MSTDNPSDSSTEIQFAQGDRITYDNRHVGRVQSAGSRYVFIWHQNPLYKLSTRSVETYGMSRGLKQKLERSNIDTVIVDGVGRIGVDELDDCELLERFDEFFNSPPAEDQFLVRFEV